MRKKELQLFNETVVNFKFFKNLYDAWKKSCHEKVYILNYKKGERIINYGKAASAFFMIGFGTIGLQVKDPAHPEGEKEAKELAVGDCFGGAEILSGIPRTYSAIAREDSLLFIMGKKDFLQMVEDNFEVREIIEKYDFIHTEPVVKHDEAAHEKSDIKADGKEGKSIISRLRGYLKLKKD
jgi:CRP-like cAMP-binding protein